MGPATGVGSIIVSMWGLSPACLQQLFIHVGLHAHVYLPCTRGSNRPDIWLVQLADIHGHLQWQYS
jgi:hypothetical protein